MATLFDIIDKQQFEDEIIERLTEALNNGADISAKDDQGWTVLHRAISKNQLDVVSFLVQEGADVNAENESGLTAPFLAARYSNWAILKWLVEERGVKIPMIDDRNRYQVETTIRVMRNVDVFSVLNGQKNAVLILGQSDSGVAVLTEFLTKYDSETCFCLTGDVDISKVKVIPPTITIDVERDIAYYGSVMGSENPPDDIASSFFLKEIIDYVEYVKIVFSINYRTIKNQKDLLKFVSSAANFIVDLSKFRRSISLIVTKVEDVDQDEEETLLYDVANSLSKLRQYIQSKNDETTKEISVQLLDIFLARVSDNYVHLGVFRVNKKPSKIISEYHGSTSAKVLRNLWFNMKGKDDFRYSISKESITLVYDLIERINIGVTFDVINVANDLRKYYTAEVNRAKNLHKLRENLNLQSKALAMMEQEIRLIPNPIELASIIVRHIDGMDIIFSGSSLKSIKHWGQCMEFLQIAAGQTYQATTWNWAKSITEVSQYLDSVDKWYEFLLDLYDTFSTYEMQKDTSKYDVANLSDWGKPNMRRGITIDQNNWEQFLSVIKHYQVKHYDHVKDMPTDRLKLKDLNHVLDLSFKKNAEVSCKGFKRIVRGNYVFLSDLMNTPCYKNAYYEVFALNTVFIDVNLNQCNLKGVIIAPRWEIIGQKVLGLKAEGQFIGIGREFVNMNNFNLYFTKGTQNLQQINMIENGTKVPPRLFSQPQFFTNSMACVEKYRLSTLEQISYNIDDYKSYLRENLNDNVQQQALIRFVRNFEQSTPITDLYDSLGFVRELQKMEDHFNELSSQIDFLPFYQSLLARLTDYSRKLKPEDNTSQRKNILTYVFAAVLSKINSMKYGSNSNLVIDIKEYLDLLSNNIMELGEIETKELDTSKKFDEIYKRAKVEQYRNDYVNEIYKQIDEANHFIQNFILPEIERISDQLVQEMEQLLKEIDEIKHQVEERKKKLEEIKRKIEVQIALRALLGIFRIFGSILSIFGPVGMIAGAAINTAVGIGEALIPDSSQELNKLEQITLPEGLDVERDLKKREITSEVAGNVASGITAVGDSITSLINNAKSDEQKLEIVKDAIKQSEEQIRQLEEFKTFVRNKVTPWVKRVVGDLQSKAKNLQGKSHVVLDVAGWQFQKSIKDLKFHLVDATKGFKVQRKFKRSIEQIGDALNTLVNIFDRIQNYQDQKKLADYIADISLVQYGEYDVKDVSLLNTTNNLERIITSNILLSYYDTAVNNFKQFTFPFADYYLEDFSVSSILTNDGNVQTLVDNAVKRIAMIKSALTQSSSTINKHFDSHLHRAYFNSQNKIVGPFYVWDHNEFRESVVNLLNGEEIALNADILRTTDDRNAVKFDYIDLQLKAVNASKQPELESKLKYFEISMTHRGNSYYRCGARFYIINTDSLTITYSFQKGNDGKPISTNLVYEKLSKGDLLLSPYAMWMVKLTPTTLPFNELKKYAHEIDLVLVGHGQYLSKNSDVCDHDLQKYYQIDETLSDLHSIYARSTQVLQEVGGQYMCISSASSVSSPLNNLIKWLLSGWSQTTWSSGDRDESKSFASHFEVNPVEFYSQVDSVLVLAPVLLHLWGKFFNRKYVANKLGKKVDIGASKIKEWENILALCGELIDVLEESLGPSHSGLIWYMDALSSRTETIQKVRVKKEVDDVVIDDLLKNLLTFYEDLSEDLKYDPMFAKAKSDERVQSAVRKLADAFKASPTGIVGTANVDFHEIIPMKPMIYLQGITDWVSNGPSHLDFCRIGCSKQHIF